jgi:hypothetical protein
MDSKFDCDRGGSRLPSLLASAKRRTTFLKATENPPQAKNPLSVISLEGNRRQIGVPMFKGAYLASESGQH